MSDGFNAVVVRNALAILDHEDAILRRDPDHFEVLGPTYWTRRSKVVRRGDQWQCNVDKPSKGYNQDHPCSHILAVLIYEGVAELPSSASAVWTKGTDGRDHGLEGQAWRLMPTRLPQLLRRLLEQGVPVIQPPPRTTRGRPPKPLYPLLYQAIIRVAWRQSLRMSQGAMHGLDHQAANPYGSCGAATLSRFLAQHEATPVLEKLLALSTWPARSYESVIHPDGTGLSEQHFSAYFDERYRHRSRAGDSKPRVHRWSYAEILWTYRYTMIAALHAEDGPFGEAQWLIPLLKRTAIMLQVAELGGDKAYSVYDVFRYAASQGIEPQIKFKSSANPTQSYWRNQAYKRSFDEWKRDPEGYAAKANRRNNAETGNHAFKAILGAEVYNKGHHDPKTGKLDFTARRNEILCMAIAYNLTRLVYLGLDRGVEIDFTGGANILRRAHWRTLVALAAEGQQEGYRVPDAARPEWESTGKTPVA